MRPFDITCATCGRVVATLTTPAPADQSTVVCGLCVAFAAAQSSVRKSTPPPPARAFLTPTSGPVRRDV